MSRPATINESYRAALELITRLREYACHAPLCSYSPTYPDGDVAQCDCGFDQVLDEYDRWSAT